ncbi:hypothetical protein [Ligilactobacillus saerimneri]|nr:hypothetical protein [Ligilactobacillus saerimneri]
MATLTDDTSTQSIIYQVMRERQVSYEEAIKLLLHFVDQQASK